MNEKDVTLFDQRVNIRIKLSALWTSVMFLYIYGDYFELYVPGKTEGLLNGQNMLDSPMKLFIAATILAIPALMIFLSLILNYSITRWVNVGVAVFLSLFTLLVGISAISEWRSFYVFLSFLETVTTLIIVYYSLTWRPEKAK